MPADSFDCQISPLTDTASLQARWQALELLADSPFFLTWNWMGPWLSLVKSPLYLFEVKQGGRDVGLAVLGAGRQRLGPLSFQTIFLNQSGDPNEDQGFIEYNGILCAASHNTEVWDGFLNHLTASRSCLPGALRSWSLLQLAGLQETSWRPRAISGFVPWREQSRLSYLVDFENIRREQEGYLGSLSANTRRQITRSKRLLAARGDVSFSVAKKPDDVDVWLPEMTALQSKWFSGKGQLAALSRPFFSNFVKQLVLDNLKSNLVEFIRFQMGDRTLGYLISLRSGAQAFSYQSAFVKFDDNKIKPGLVCHSILIEHYLEQGLDQYNFLVGDSQYKFSLSNRTEALNWLTLGHRTPAIQLLSGVKTLLAR